ncbi:hypothetical protein ACHAPU_004344 [Fusarium lateritium]
MPSKSTAHVDESTSSFYFSDPCAALSFFNNDLTESVIWSDLGYVSDYNESYDEPPIPPGYLTNFQVQLPSPLVESDNSSAMSSSSHSSNNGVYNRKLSNDETFPPSTTDSQCSDPDSDSLGSDGTNNGKQNNITKAHVQTRQKTPSVSPKVTKVANEKAPNLPSYHVHQLCWKKPVNTRQLAKRSKQHRREVGALWWDTYFTTFASGSSQARGNAQYREELKDYRRERRNGIETEPTDQQCASNRKLLKRVKEIEDARREKIEEGWTPRSSNRL